MNVFYWCTGHLGESHGYALALRGIPRHHIICLSWPFLIQLSHTQGHSTAAGIKQFNFSRFSVFFWLTPCFKQKTELPVLPSVADSWWDKCGQNRRCHFVYIQQQTCMVHQQTKCRKCVFWNTTSFHLIVLLRLLQNALNFSGTVLLSPWKFCRLSVYSRPKYLKLQANRFSMNMEKHHQGRGIQQTLCGHHITHFLFRQFRDNGITWMFSSHVHNGLHTRSRNSLWHDFIDKVWTFCLNIQMYNWHSVYRKRVWAEVRRPASRKAFCSHACLLFRSDLSNHETCYTSCR